MVIQAKKKKKTDNKEKCCKSYRVLYIYMNIYVYI